MKLDMLDKKILAVLDQDARMTETAIGKATGTSKQAIHYRLKRLEEKGIVENYYTMLDVGQLGFDSYYVFVQVTGLSSDEEKEVYGKIMKLPQVAWIVTGVGRWDAVILFCAQSVQIFNEQLMQVKKMFGKNLHELTFTMLVQAEHISYKFLETKNTEPLKTTPKNKEYSLDEEDKKILEVINQKGRMAVTEISEKTKLPIHAIHYRLKKLKKDKAIQGFRPKINVQKLGIQWHLLLIKFNSDILEQGKTFLEYCRQNNKVYYVTNTVGKYDIMLDVHVKNTEEFRTFLFELKNSFADLILLYESMLVFEELLITYIPKIALE